MILYAIWKLPVRKNVPEEKHAAYWSIAFFGAFAIVAFRLLNGLDYRAYGILIVTAIAGGMIALVVASLWEMRRQKLR